MKIATAMIANKKRKVNIPIFVSHQGCPNDCIFCNQKKITGVCEKEREDAVRKKIENFLFHTAPDCNIEISFFGGSFTGIPMEEQNMYLSVANEFFCDSRVTGIRLSTRPDYISEEILINLKKYNVTTIELGVQSMENKVLQMNKRGLKAEDVYVAVKLIREYGFSLGLQMMTGMYGSTPKMDIKTAEKIIGMKPDCVRIYPTVVIEETELFNLYKSGEYMPQSIDDAVDLCAVLIKMFEEKDIPVIRLGLMAGEDINENKVFGPYHSSFRELTESRIIYTEISEFLKENPHNGKVLEIFSNKRFVSKIVGNKRSNIEKIMKEFKLSDVKISENNQIEKYKFKII